MVFGRVKSFLEGLVEFDLPLGFGRNWYVMIALVVIAYQVDAESV